MIYVTPAVVLSETVQDANLARIGIQSLINEANIAADEEAVGFPSTNLANTSTAERWKGTTTGVQYITVNDGGTQQVDYFAIARHNLGSTGATVKLQSSPDGTTWTDCSEAIAPANDTAVIVRTVAATANFWRLELTPGTDPLTIAVFYLGRLIVVERRIQVGHTPITLGKEWSVTTGRSTSGQFLGRILRSEWRVSQVTWANLTPSWVRDTFSPFVDQAATRPFFWAWRPDTWPSECGYVWTPSAPKCSNTLPNGMMQASMDLQGIA
jgi:hypothetical protein